MPNLSELKLESSVVPCIRDLGTGLHALRVLWMPRCKLSELDGLAALQNLQVWAQGFLRLSVLIHPYTHTFTHILHTCTHIHIHVHTHTYTHIRTYTYTNTHTHTYINTCACRSCTLLLTRFTISVLWPCSVTCRFLT